MGSVSFTFTEVKDPTPLNSSAGWLIMGGLTMSSSYANPGGDSFTLAALGGYKQLLKMIIAVPLVGGVVLAPDITNLKVKALWTGAGLSGALAEVTGGTDLHLTVAPFIAFVV